MNILSSKPGFFITFEGGEGVGKSTQIEMLAKALRSLGRTVTVSREPGGTPGAEAVRHVLLNAGLGEPFGPECEAMLFAAARNDHVEQIIRPAVARGEIVLVDRFMDSTRVYQGMSNALDPAFIAIVERLAIAGMMPDLTILLDLPPEQGLARAANRRKAGETADRFEKETINIHQKRRDAFLALADQEPNRISIINAAGEQRDIARHIWQVVSKHPATRSAAAKSVKVTP